MYGWAGDLGSQWSQFWGRLDQWSGEECGTRSLMSSWCSSLDLTLASETLNCWLGEGDQTSPGTHPACWEPWHQCCRLPSWSWSCGWGSWRVSVISEEDDRGVDQEPGSWGTVYHWLEFCWWQQLLGVHCSWYWEAGVCMDQCLLPCFHCSLSLHLMKFCSADRVCQSLTRCPWPPSCWCWSSPPACSGRWWSPAGAGGCLHSHATF